MNESDVELNAAVSERLTLLASSGAGLTAAADALVGAIDAHWRERQYNDCPPAVQATEATVVGDRDADFVARLWHSVLLRFVQLSLETRLPAFPEALADRARRQYRRILQYVADNAYDELSRPYPTRDLFSKDLGLARLTMLPAEGRVLDIYGALPRRQLLTRFPASLPAYWLAIVRLGGLAPYFGVHLHAPLYADWTANQRQVESFLNNLLVIEAYLGLMPEIRGSLSYGWLHDPALVTVSPHLTHQNTIPAAYGAAFIETGMADDMLSGALESSKTRRRLYEEGTYRPRSFIRVWGRSGIIRCCEDYRRGRLDPSRY